jgi:hypothetical protein
VSNGLGQVLVYGVLAGTAIAILFFLKFTLIAVLPAAIVFLALCSSPFRNRAFFLGTLLFTFLAYVAGYILYISALGALGRLREVLSWLSGYGATQAMFAPETIRSGYFLQFPANFVSAFTPTGIVLALFGAYAAGRRLLRSRGGELSIPDPYGYLFLQLLFGLLGVMLEGKFFRYHFLRVAWAFAPFVGLGLSFAGSRLPRVWQRLRELIPMHRMVMLGIASLLLVLASFFSPLVQIVSQPIYWTLQRARGANIPDAVTSRDSEFCYSDMVKVSTILNRAMKPSDNFFLWGNHCAPYFLTNRTPQTIALVNSPFVSSFTPPTWKPRLLNQIRQTDPRFFVVELLDQHDMSTHTRKDSYQLLLEWPELHEFLMSRYQYWTRTDRFLIYERRE